MGPLQAYRKGFYISNAIALTHTHKEDWTLQDWVAPNDAGLDLPKLQEAESRKTVQPESNDGVGKAQKVRPERKWTNN